MNESAGYFLENCPESIRSSFLLVDFQPGTLILAQGDAPSFVYFLLEGEASVTLLTLNCISYLEYIYSNDELFGELEVFNNQPMACNVRARKVCRTIRVDKKDFLRWFDEDTQFARFVTRQMADKLYLACQNMVTNIAYPLIYRVLFYLWHAAKQGQHYICKEDLISGLGSNERSINRVLKDLLMRQIIEQDRGVLRILDEEIVREEMAKFE